jgi:hypothetical protein
MDEVTPDQILAFLKKADAVSWPEGLRPTDKAELHGFLETHFREGDWEFYDAFGGEVTDIGLEIVSYKGKAIWGASYRGGVLTSSDDVEQIFAFLVEALKAPNDSALPIRGPRRFDSGDGRLAYRYGVIGSFASFLAIERIMKDGEPAYERTLAGGYCGECLYGPRIELYDHLWERDGGGLEA